MNAPASDPAIMSQVPVLATRCQEVGLGLLYCDPGGRVISFSPESDEVLERLSTQAAAQLVAILGDVQSERVPEPQSLAPGLWLLPFELVERRRTVGFFVGIALTSSVREATGMDVVCQLLDIEVDVLESWFEGRTTVIDDDEVPRLFRHFTTWSRDLKAIADNQGELESVGQQLCESYEELSLLYKLGDNMSVVRQPHRFIASMCKELRQVLPFRWIGVKLLNWPQVDTNINGLFIYDGEIDQSFDELSRKAEELLAIAEFNGGSLVVDRHDRTNMRLAAPFGRSLIVHPMYHKRVLAGAVFAVEKTGNDPILSTSDIKMIEVASSHLRMFLENAMLYEQMQQMFMGTLESLTAAIDAKDPYTRGHSQRVAMLSQMIARAIDLDDQTVERVHIAGLVHDVGKIGVPEAVLCKAGRLTDAEFDAIKEHPAIGARILRDIPNFQDIIPGVLYHHERFDGRGYPCGLKGRNIPLFGRIIAIADSFDAMSSTRTYREALSREHTLGEIETNRGTQFDPDLAVPFLELDFSHYDAMIDEHARQERDRRGEAA